eukprot:Em0014g219a
MVDEDQKNWDVKIETDLMGYRASFQASTKLKVYKYPDEHKESNEDMDAKSEKNEGTDARSEENEGADAKREENGRKGGSNKDNGKESASNEENGKEANGVSDMSKKRSVLLGSKAYQTLASLVAPETPGAKLYEELLKELARKCEFGNALNDMLRGRLVYIDGVLITMELDTLELPYPLFQNQRLGASRSGKVLERLPFGVSSAPSIFQRIMESLFQGIPKVIVYIDEILITGGTDKEHLETLEKSFLS